jgi:hypothetical protein
MASTRRGSSRERHFRGGKVRLLQRSSESGEDYSDKVRIPERTAPAEFKKQAGAICSTENRYFPTWYCKLWWVCSPENPVRRNPELKRTRTDIMLKKLKNKLKINLICKTLNFASLQGNYMQASPISRDYPFNGFSLFDNLYFIVTEQELPVFSMLKIL